MAEMIKPRKTNTEFALSGVNHVALVCSDMARTVDFYSNVLGMPLIKALDLPGGMGQHFFFDAGNGDCVAFFYKREPVRPRFCVAVFNLLHQGGNSHFEKLIKIAAAYRKKLQAFEQWIILILGFFEHAAVELQPRKLAIDVISRLVYRCAGHVGK